MSFKPPKDAILAWHTVHHSKYLTYNMRNVKVEEGKTYTATKYHGGVNRITCCQYGLHASIEISDLIMYWRGPVVCRVYVYGSIDKQSDKVAGQYRHVLWMRSAYPALRGAVQEGIDEVIEHLRTKSPYPRRITRPLIKWYSQAYRRVVEPSSLDELRRFFCESRSLISEMVSWEQGNKQLLRHTDLLNMVKEYLLECRRRPEPQKVKSVLVYVQLVCGVSPEEILERNFLRLEEM